MFLMLCIIRHIELQQTSPLRVFTTFGFTRENSIACSNKRYRRCKVLLPVLLSRPPHSMENSEEPIEEVLADWQGPEPVFVNV
jgi:hypothetical protein